MAVEVESTFSFEERDRENGRVYLVGPGEGLHREVVGRPGNGDGRFAARRSCWPTRSRDIDMPINGVEATRRLLPGSSRSATPSELSRRIDEALAADAVAHLYKR
jgi:hypothetical protein